MTKAIEILNERLKIIKKSFIESSLKSEKSYEHKKKAENYLIEIKQINEAINVLEDLSIREKSKKNISVYVEEIKANEYIKELKQNKENPTFIKSGADYDELSDMCNGSKHLYGTQYGKPFIPKNDNIIPFGINDEIIDWE